MSTTFPSSILDMVQKDPFIISGEPQGWNHADPKRTVLPNHRTRVFFPPVKAAGERSGRQILDTQFCSSANPYEILWIRVAYSMLTCDLCKLIPHQTNPSAFPCCTLLEVKATYFSTCDPHRGKYPHINSDILYRIYCIWRCIWHKFWHNVWHLLWHLVWQLVKSTTFLALLNWKIRSKPDQFTYTFPHVFTCFRKVWKLWWNTVDGCEVLHHLG